MPDYKIVQFRRGTTLEHASFVGAQGEVTVDTDKWCCVVHDGITPGGFPLKVEAVEYTRARYLTFRAALVQQGVPSLGFSAPDNAPTASAVIETSGLITGVATFDPAIEQSIQDHFMLPENWIGPIGLDIVWRSEATIGQVSWRVETCDVPLGSSLETVTFDTPLNATTIVSVPNAIMTSTTSIPANLYNPGDEVYFRITRNIASLDTVTTSVDMISLRWTVLVLDK